MSMQRRHYQFVADVMKDTKPSDLGPAEMDQWSATVDLFVRRFRADNYRFQEDRFRKACGQD
ncbi:hypothetical protein [Caulobacter phage BL198]|uniref:Uncharacterized protein n=1 Tax=Caulobacter phage BL198 TaxID=3020395 RepID=A0AAF0B953_9CAUD|nr:hypothetical protein [Caulobacter phage BL198]